MHTQQAALVIGPELQRSHLGRISVPAVRQPLE